jgi:hypothetical protein
MRLTASNDLVHQRHAITLNPSSSTSHITAASRGKLRLPTTAFTELHAKLDQGWLDLGKRWRVLKPTTRERAADCGTDHDT